MSATGTTTTSRVQFIPAWCHAPAGGWGPEEADCVPFSPGGAPGTPVAALPGPGLTGGFLVGGGGIWVAAGGFLPAGVLVAGVLVAGVLAAGFLAGAGGVIGVVVA